MTDDGPTILLAHGAGGLLSRELVTDLFLKHRTTRRWAPWAIGHPSWNTADFCAAGGRLALTTDSYVVSRWSSRGDIGSWPCAAR